MYGCIIPQELPRQLLVLSRNSLDNCLCCLEMNIRPILQVVYPRYASSSVLSRFWADYGLVFGVIGVKFLYFG